MRYVDQDFRITASRPPPPLLILLSLALVGGLFALIGRQLERRRAGQLHLGNRVLTVFILLIVILFALYKTEFLATAVSGWWRGLTGQDQALASMVDLRWVGFSFVAFRLIHTLRDRQQGILPVMSLREFISYAIFFPAYTAGPIDRAERFVPEFRALPDLVGFNSSRWARGLSRIFIGMFKKFVIADTLAQGMSLTAENAVQAESTLGLWLLLYGYALRLYFDFAGYSDIAIGIGILFGIKLPENFDRPYLKSNITAFWQSWHITLSNWVRFYVFTPLSRWLLRRTWRPSSTIIVFVAQVTTMVVMGLWHGVTWNFFIWGLWHGLGLFVHKQWSDRTRMWYRELSQSPGRKRTWTTLTCFGFG
jgi:alginate O-acetyltransferase complex protein AlgI